MQRPQDDTIAAWSAFLVAHRRLTQLLDEQLEAEVGLSLEEYDVLYQIRRAEAPLHMTELAERVLITRPTATRLVDRLVDRGLVARRHDDIDRRVVLLSLTAEGRRSQGRAARAHLAGLRRYVEVPLAGHDLTAFKAALAALATGR